MTVSTTTARKSGPFPGDDVTIVFQFDWKVFLRTDVRVVRINVTLLESELVLDTDFSVTLNVDQDTTPGGDVTLLLGPLASADQLLIVSDVSNLQEIELPSAGPWNPRVIEAALDKLAIDVQQVQEKIERAVLFPVSEVLLFPVEFPAAPVRAEKNLGFNASGDLIAGGNFVSGAVTVSAFMETVLDDASAAAALGTLGFDTFPQSLIGAANAASYRSLIGFSAFGGTSLGGATSAPDALDALGFSAFSKTLVGEGSASAWLSTLGFSTYGESIASLADAAALRSQLGFSAFGDTWVALANAAAGRTALGLGTMAVQNAAIVAITGGTIVGITDLAIADGGTGASTAGAAFNAIAASGGTVGGALLMGDNLLTRPLLKDYSIESEAVASSGGILTLDMTTGNAFTATLTENIAAVVVSNPPATGTFGELWLALTQAAGGFTVSWAATYKFPAGTDHTMSANNGDIDVLHLKTVNGGTSWFVDFQKGYA